MSDADFVDHPTLRCRPEDSSRSDLVKTAEEWAVAGGLAAVVEVFARARAELCTTLRKAFVATGSVLANVPPLLALMAEYTM